jgi:hypothetical protein
LAFGSAPAGERRPKISEREAAGITRWRGVFPDESVTFGSAPAASKSAVHSIRPFRTASWSGVELETSLTFACALRSRRYWT